MRHGERVGVIVVNWNSGDLLLPCVESIAGQTIAPERVLIVDNASTDGSLAVSYTHLTLPTNREV